MQHIYSDKCTINNTTVITNVYYSGKELPSSSTIEYTVIDNDTKEEVKIPIEFWFDSYDDIIKFDRLFTLGDIGWGITVMTYNNVLITNCEFLWDNREHRENVTPLKVISLYDDKLHYREQGNHKTYLLSEQSSSLSKLLFKINIKLREILNDL